LVVVRGRTADDKIAAAARAFGQWDIVEGWRRAPGWLAGLKMKASNQGVQAKWWSGSARVTID